MSNSATPIAVLQMCATANIDTNLSTTETLIRKAARSGAKAVFAPEAFTFIGPSAVRAKFLEPLPEGGPVLKCCQSMAIDNSVHFIFGFHERAPDGRSYNTCVHLDPTGEIRAMYRKIHMFDVDLPDGTRLLESKGTAPGEKPVVTKLPFGTLGLTVCYDVRFPGLYQHLVDLGATALSVPSAFTQTTGRDHWHVLLRARAIECQSYVIAAAQYGEHGHGNRASYGHSLIIDPWGEVIAECPETGADFAIATIDPEKVRRVRQDLPSLANRKF